MTVSVSFDSRTGLIDHVTTTSTGAAKTLTFEIWSPDGLTLFYGPKTYAVSGGTNTDSLVGLSASMIKATGFFGAVWRLPVVIRAEEG